MRTTGRTLPALVAVCLSGALLTACSSDDGAAAPPAPGTTPTTAPAAAEGSDLPTQEPTDDLSITTTVDPLVLTTSTVRGESCFDRRVSDLSWFDVTWQAHADLESFSFELIDPVGVIQVGSPVNLSPVNFGGRIDYSGSTSWRTRAEGFDVYGLDDSRRDTVELHSPIEGETGLVAFHLRLDPAVMRSAEGASITGVNASYTLLDGTTAEAEVDLPMSWRRGC